MPRPAPIFRYSLACRFKEEIRSFKTLHDIKKPAE